MLKKGDKIALVAPSGWFSKSDLENALDWFKKQGLKTQIMPHAYDVEFYAAGTPQNRAKDINDAFRDKSVKAIFCIRGGAGSLKVLDFLDFEMIKKNPKPVFGLSDSTALQNALYTITKNVSYTGFLPIYDFKENHLDSKIENSLFEILNNKKQEIKEFEVLKKGEAEGVLIGGCLSVFNTLCGTKYFPKLKNKILLIEDVGEKTYRIDLMLDQLKKQKDFDKVKAIIFGSFLNCKIADIGDGTIDEIIKNFAKNLDIPVIYNFPYGHIKSRFILPIGKKIKLKTKSSITF